MFALAVSITTFSMPAHAFLLRQSGSCSPGQKWDTSRPISVRLLADSYFDYLDKRVGTSDLLDLVRIDNDIKAVIARYNAIPGSGLVLEHGSGIVGDSNLEEPEDDDFGTRTIVIGFTDEEAGDSSPAEAWTPGDPADGCTRTRAHILFRKDVNWTFGPPDTTDVDPRHFSTTDQPRQVDSTLPHTFLGILTHEMGHAVGLSHPDDDYAVMAQKFKTWFRGPDNVLRSGLLPDDEAGVLALYRTFDARTHLNISVTNTWYKSAEAQFGDCTDEIARVDTAARAISEATGLPVDGQFPADVIFKGEHVALFDALESAQDALRGCEATQNAVQVNNCAVSSRGDGWTGKLTGVDALCAVNGAGSAYPDVSEKVCPGDQIQLRYTLNNHSVFRDALIRSEVWLSRDTALNARDGSDRQSPDVREFTIKAGTSASIGQVFRLPGNAPVGERLRVFVRAVPFDVQSGARLWNSDADRWDNAIMVRRFIDVSSASCS